MLIPNRKMAFIVSFCLIASLLAVACSEADSQPAAGVSDAKEAPRFSDGTVLFDFGEEESGYWAEPSVDSLVETGVDVEMDGKGLLANLDDAPIVAPFMPWSLALYRYRQENGLKDDPTRACISPGGPRHIHDKAGFRIIQDRNYDRVYIVFGGGNMNWRVIFMDDREPPNVDEVTGSYFGHSTGHWEGDTLVVESSAFTDRFWFSNGGLPHTRALKLVERFSRPDYATLQYEVTVDDPYTYTRPWTSAWTLNWMEGREIEQQFCEDTREYGTLKNNNL